MHKRRLHCNINKRLVSFAVYVIELALKYSPFPLSVERKEYTQAEALYHQVRNALEKGRPELLDLTCEKLESKKIAVLVSEILAVQIYEKTASSIGTKRPGFTVDA